MNITKHGENSKDKTMPEEFKCGQCGCEFTADYDEYYVEKESCWTASASTTYVYKATVTDNYICSCPECHKIVVKEKSRLIENPTITLNGTSTYVATDIPDPCKTCSNHPSNGGSGNCNCVLGTHAEE